MSNRQMFDQQLGSLYQSSCALLRQIEASLLEALGALQHHQAVDLTALIAGDQQINEQVQRLRNLTIRLIATQQPMACDLRSLSVMLRMLPDIERMGDHVASLAKIQRRIWQRPDCLPLAALPGECPTILGLIGHTVAAMLNGSTAALEARDAEMARRVAAMDYEVDVQYGQFFQASLDLIESLPVAANQAIHLLRLAHHLERIGDLITNLAEQVVFLSTGVMINLNPKRPFGVELIVEALVLSG
jgi:phosphate transport system protein